MMFQPRVHVPAAQEDRPSYSLEETINRRVRSCCPATESRIVGCRIDCLTPRA